MDRGHRDRVVLRCHSQNRNDTPPRTRPVTAPPGIHAPTPTRWVPRRARWNSHRGSSRHPAPGLWQPRGSTARTVHQRTRGKFRVPWCRRRSRVVRDLARGQKELARWSATGPRSPTTAIGQYLASKDSVMSESPTDTITSTMQPPGSGCRAPRSSDIPYRSNRCSSSGRAPRSRTGDWPRAVQRSLPETA